MISVGMVLFGYADFKVSPDFNIMGIGLVCVSVAADSFLPNYQEKIFDHGSSRLEVTYYTNILCLAAMTFFFSLNGELQVSGLSVIGLAEAISLLGYRIIGHLGTRYTALVWLYHPPHPTYP